MTMNNLPNIIFILADDMGYGDMAANNRESKIPTPNLDRLCREGMRFTDAHAGTSVCTPSRYNILTGRYSWRSQLKNGIVWEWDHSLIEENRKTVAHLLKEQGYDTHCIGKWHLGWDWATKDGSLPNDTLVFGSMSPRERQTYEEKIDYSQPVKGGPVDRGFDSYFGVDVPNFPPYTWFENDRLLIPPTEKKPQDMFGNPGAAAPGWDLKAMLPRFAQKAVDLIKSKSENEKPFFLYFALTSPHTPICPNEPFTGKSGAGKYGDFVMESDWVVGEVMKALDDTGQSDNTLLIFTSDNGPERETSEDIGAYNRIKEHGHNSSADLRGIKRDAWEGGHRVPYAARWPRVTKAGSVCSQLISLGDFWDTCRDICSIKPQAGAGEDSVSILPLLQGKIDKPTREYTIHHSMSGKFAVRKDNWVFIEASCGGDNEEPDWYRKKFGYTQNTLPGELYNLARDRQEKQNLYEEKPELVEMLSGLIKESREETFYPSMNEEDDQA
jgi:arylsulfatase A